MGMHRSILVLLAAGGLAACGVPNIPGVTPYRMEIQQGNMVTQDMVARLETGMSREQVRILLGTPLVTDIFHADRWDYIYWREPVGGGSREQRRLAVYFSGDKLSRLEGDVVARK